jgi:hypothetical protein
MISEGSAISDVRLRPLSAGVFEAESEGLTVKVNVERKPPSPSEKEVEEELVRTSNPEPTVGAFLKLGDDLVATHTSDPAAMGPSEVEKLSTWIEQQGSADRLVVNVGADHITTGQIKRLAAVGKRHRLAVDVNLRANG